MKTQLLMMRLIALFCLAARAALAHQSVNLVDEHIFAAAKKAGIPLAPLTSDIEFLAVSPSISQGICRRLSGSANSTPTKHLASGRASSTNSWKSAQRA